ncbi:hypothetical protein H1D32_16510 [Anaerobacillus sp. CMMVII]|uniref:hypothetical protein n=1 Tax=Anaerobacillus sp. CMMVII TaxID=2755588 RepID=UPI0021B7A98B|nr:hypothetical protein [Anaerobacillus sp. CMMVII]MCT8139165.1 hypothetical protein [Anaerobacillus sp. CMMVII]
MNYFKVFVIAILMVSLIINARLLVRVSDLDNRIDSMSYSQMEIRNRVENQTSSMQYVLEEFKNEQSWISGIQMEVDPFNIANGKTTLNFNWQIKELFNDSEVVFHYKYGKDQQFRSVPANEAGNGIFKANVSLDIALEPEWYTGFSIPVGNDYSEVEERAYEDNYSEKMNKHEFSYYVTVSNDNLLRSSEIHFSNFAHLGTDYYGILDLFVDIHDKGYHISVMRPDYYTENGVYLDEVYVKKFKNGVLIDEEKLVSNSNEARTQPYEFPLVFQNQTKNEPFEFSSLVIRVVYNNGQTFEKEVPFN